MSRETKNPELVLLENKAQLLEVFQGGGRPHSEFSIGLEVELLGVDKKTGRAIPYEGEAGVEGTLQRLMTREPWLPVFDKGRLISLDRDGSAITLEPGGQLELSTRPHRAFSELRDELFAHAEALTDVSEPYGVRWLALGLQPVTPLKEMPWVPKSRYRIMRQYYEARQGTPLDMMALTASIQTNFDYTDEHDAKTKVRVGSVLGPVVGAMMANSAVEKGGLNGYCSRRLAIWPQTDPDRCGVPAFFVDGSFSFEKYAEYALDVPMYFVLRNGEYLDQTDWTFRRYWSEKPRGDVLEADWQSHLTTLFPDVRLRNHIEFRTSDAVSKELALALVAFWKGIIHDPHTLELVAKRLEAFTVRDIRDATLSAAVAGLQATIGAEPILQVARDVVCLADIGLSRTDQAEGTNDVRWLDPLHELVERGTSPAEETRKHWHGNLDHFLKASAI